MKHAASILALCAATICAACSAPAPARTRSHERAASDVTSDAKHATDSSKAADGRDAPKAADATEATKPAERLPHEVDLTSRWATGSTNEPAVAKIVLQPPCRITPAAWILQQRGDTIEAWSFPESFAQGISRGPVGPATEPARGRVSGLNVILRDAQSRYVLRYDTWSGHLRGTKSGAPFWAVRQEIVRVSDCPPVP
jgi:hypothetical protein